MPSHNAFFALRDDVIGVGRFVAAGVHPASWLGSSTTHRVCREKDTRQQLFSNIPNKAVVGPAAFSDAVLAFAADIHARHRIAQNPSLHNYTFVHVNESSLEEGTHPNMLLVKELVSDASTSTDIVPEFWIEVPPNTGEEIYYNGAIRQFTRQMGRALARSFFGTFLLYLRSRASGRF